MRRFAGLFGVLLAFLLFAPWVTEPAVANDVDPPISWENASVDEHTVLSTNAYSIDESDILGISASTSLVDVRANPANDGVPGHSRASPDEALTSTVNFNGMLIKRVVKGVYTDAGPRGADSRT